MNNKKTKVVPAKEVLTPAEQPVIVEAITKRPKKKYHKKQKNKVTVEVAPVVIKLNWFKRMWKKFLIWYNS